MNNSVEEGVFRSFDGTELFFQTWPATRPKAVVIGVHGLGEHVAGYNFLAQAIGVHEYQLTMFDHRGHGKSEGNRGVGSIDDFVLDLKMFIQAVKAMHPGSPIFLLGHSMGGLVLTKFLIRNGLTGAKAAIFSSPLLGVTVDIPAWKKKSAGFLSKVAPNMTLNNEIPNKNLSHDFEVIKSYERDHLRHDRISTSLFINMLDTIEFVFKNVDKMPEKVLYQVAGEDLVVSRPEAERFFNLIPGNKKKIIVYEKYYHEVYNEVGRQKVFTDLIDWLNQN